MPPRAWPTGTHLRGLVQDHSNGVLWVWGDAGLLRVRVAHEERHVWRLHLEATNFAAALSYCSPTETLQRDAVLTAQAHYVFDHGDFELAATLFSKTKLPIEDVAMRFIAARQCRALRTFLLHKLDSIEDIDIAQSTIMCTWLTDIYLHTLTDVAETTTHGEAARELRVFFVDKRQRLHRPTTQFLIDVQGCIEEALYFAILCDDCERAVSLRVQQRHPEEALATLSAILNVETHHHIGAEREREVVSLLEKFSSQLMLLAPERLVDVWMRARTIAPAKVLPAVMNYELRSGHGIETFVVSIGMEMELHDRYCNIAKTPTMPSSGTVHQGIRCLQPCIGALRCERQDWVDYLTLLHAKHSPDAQLLLHLSDVRIANLGEMTLGAARDEVGAPAPTLWKLPYNPQHAIKLCLECGRVAGCVATYQCCGMGPEAVELALSERHSDLAEQSADAVQPDWLRKALWLQVAGWAIDAQGCTHSAKAIELEWKKARDILTSITESYSHDDKPVLQFEDLLMLFHAVTKVHDVHQPLCASLLAYAQAAEGTHNEIIETADAVKRLLDEIGFLEVLPDGSRVEQFCDCSELRSLGITTQCGPAIRSTHITYPCHHSFCENCLGLAVGNGDSCSDKVPSECPLCSEQMVEQVSCSFLGTGDERQVCGAVVK